MAFNEKQLSKVSKNNKTEVDRNSNALTRDMQKVFEVLANGLYSESDIMTMLGYTYKEIPITTPELLSMGSSPIEILPAPESDQYYEYSYVIETWQSGGTGRLVIPTDESYYIGTDDYNGGTYMKQQIFNSGGGIRVVFGGSITPSLLNTLSGELNASYITPGQQLFFTVSNNTDPIGFVPGGEDATALVKIWYKVRTIGSEL